MVLVNEPPRIRKNKPRRSGKKNNLHFEVDVAAVSKKQMENDLNALKALNALENLNNEPPIEEMPQEPENPNDAPQQPEQSTVEDANAAQSAGEQQAVDQASRVQPETDNEYFQRQVREAENKRDAALPKNDTSGQTKPATTPNEQQTGAQLPSTTATTNKTSPPGEAAHPKQGQEEADQTRNEGLPEDSAPTDEDLLNKDNGETKSSEPQSSDEQKPANEKPTEQPTPRESDDEYLKRQVQGAENTRDGKPADDSVHREEKPKPAEPEKKPPTRAPMSKQDMHDRLAGKGPQTKAAEAQKKAADDKKAKAAKDAEDKKNKEEAAPQSDNDYFKNRISEVAGEHNAKNNNTEPPKLDAMSKDNAANDMASSQAKEGGQQPENLMKGDLPGSEMPGDQNIAPTQTGASGVQKQPGGAPASAQNPNEKNNAAADLASSRSKSAKLKGNFTEAINKKIGNVTGGLMRGGALSILRRVIPGLDAILSKIENANLQVKISLLETLRGLLKKVQTTGGVLEGLRLWGLIFAATWEFIITIVILIVLLPVWIMVYAVYGKNLGSKIASTVEKAIKAIDDILGPLKKELLKKKLAKIALARSNGMQNSVEQMIALRAGGAANDNGSRGQSSVTPLRQPPKMGSIPPAANNSIRRAA